MELPPTRDYFLRLGPPRAVPVGLLDFDSTLSLLRGGWPQVDDSR